MNIYWLTDNIHPVPVWSGCPRPLLCFYLLCDSQATLYLDLVAKVLWAANVDCSPSRGLSILYYANTIVKPQYITKVCPKITVYKNRKCVQDEKKAPLVTYFYLLGEFAPHCARHTVNMDTGLLTTPRQVIRFREWGETLCCCIFGYFLFVSPHSHHSENL